MPKNPQFSVLFTQQARIAAQTAQALCTLLQDYTEVEAKVQAIRDLEHEADRLSKQLVEVLSQSFIVPFDREDIIQLIEHLDDVVDDIEEAARKLVLYRVRQPSPQAATLAEIVRQQAEVLAQGMPLLESAGRYGELRQLMEQVRQLEDQGDQVSDEVQVGLYDGVTDVPGMVAAMRMGEILALLESAIDQAQRVAKTVENVMLKNA